MNPNCTIRRTSSASQLVCGIGRDMLATPIVPGCDGTVADGRQWGVFLDRRLLCDAHGREHAPELAVIADRLNELPPLSAEDHHGVALREKIIRPECQACGVVLDMREQHSLVVGIVVAVGVSTWCHECREEQSPRLSAILHELQGTVPAYRKVAAPRVRTVEEVIEDARCSVAISAARVLFGHDRPDKRVSSDEVRRARELLEIFAQFQTAGRSPEGYRPPVGSS